MGHWKNFDELEENLNIHELNAIAEAAREQNYKNWKFQASLKGINLDEQNNNSDSFEEVKMRAQAKLNGVSEEQLHFQAIGFGLEEE